MYTMEVMPVHDHQNPFMVFSILGQLALPFHQIQVISISWKETGSMYLPFNVVECLKSGTSRPQYGNILSGAKGFFLAETGGYW